MSSERSVSGTWYNQHGSVLTLEVDPRGRLSGEFRSHSGLAKPSDPCIVKGFVASQLISFIADFSQFDSLTSWTGHRVTEEEQEVIRACWHMAVMLPMKDRAEETWRGVWTGEDEFRRAPFKQRSGEGRLPSHPFLYWP